MSQRVLTESIRTKWGLLAGSVSAAIIGATLWFGTPFEPIAAAGIAASLALLGAAGRMVLGAIKRDRGVRYYGEMVIGHGGVLDRVDSLMFAAPAFVHVLPWLLSAAVLVR
jgi:phosphatidate cytidylyltransferase